MHGTDTMTPVDIAPQQAGDETSTTVAEAVRTYEAQGYTGQFATRRGGTLACLACHADIPAAQVSLHALSRIEGASDPADEALVAALECPRCAALGTGVFMYGPTAPPEDDLIVHDLRDVRPVHEDTAGA